MRFEIDHTIRYRYTGKVYLEPFAVRLRPKTDVNQRLLDFDLQVDPEPLNHSEVNELDGNATTLLWFEGLHDSLVIRARSSVETHRDNPFDFLISDEECREVPLAYPGGIRPLLAPYLQPREEIPEPVRTLADEVKSRSHETIPFLFELLRAVHARVKTVVRDEGDPLQSEELLARGEGACRDVAVLFMEACRTVGMAARFVSGYQETSEDAPEVHLHAWAEVYIPGGGWRGFDPTIGLAVSDRHVVLASGAHPAQAAPTSGTFRGTGVRSEMDYSLSVAVSPEGPADAVRSD